MNSALAFGDSLRDGTAFVMGYNPAGEQNFASFYCGTEIKRGNFETTRALSSSSDQRLEQNIPGIDR
jgi:hypothetical protein